MPLVRTQLERKYDSGYKVRARTCEGSAFPVFILNVVTFHSEALSTFGCARDVPRLFSIWLLYAFALHTVMW